MEFRSIENESEVLRVFPVMHELRSHLNEEEFLRLVQAARVESDYRLIGLYDGSECLGLMGYRVLTDLVHGRHLYIDDLVTTQARRSQGLGARFLARAKELAREHGCRRLRLSTGIQNDRGQGFYERNGWALRSVTYKCDA